MDLLLGRSFIAGLLCCAFGASCKGAATQPWDQAFSGSGAEVAKAAATISGGNSDVVLLLDEYHYILDKDGNTATTHHRVYRILTAQDLDEWASVEQEWEPWHEKKPKLRARVIGPDGNEHWLDAKTVVEAPVVQYDNTIFSDSRVLRAPLPAVTVGAVIEYEFTQQDTAPLFAAGVAHYVRRESTLPSERFHITIDAAQGLNLRTSSDLIPASAISRTEKPDGTHLEVDVGRIDPTKDWESATPPSVKQYQEFRFSTGETWQTIAVAYNRIVEKQISQVQLGDLAEAAKGPFPNVLAAAEKLTALLHDRVRYTGVEFGESSIVPTPPTEVLRRHYGDCKDKATLLVALLKTAGYSAHLALLHAGQIEDLDPDLAGFGFFNHAIVFVDGHEPFWIDATAETARVGTLPVGDQNRLALVISPSATLLSKTPQISSTENRVVHTIAVHFAQSGKGSIHETVEGFGTFEAELRARFGGTQHETEKAAETFAKGSFGGDGVDHVAATPKNDFSRTFQLSMDVKNSTAAVTSLQEAEVRISNSFLFEDLPWALMPRQQENARKHDLIVQRPYVAEVRFLISPPDTFSLRELPAAEKWSESAASYAMISKKNANGTVEVDYRFELKSSQLKPDEVEAVKSHLKGMVASRLIAFDTRGQQMLAVGKTAQALQEAKKATVDRPDDALAHMRFSQMLWQSGAGAAAIAAAKRAVEIDPKSARAWLMLAYAYEHDSFGRLRTGDWNPVEAEKALRKSVELDATDVESQTELAIFLEHDATGQRYSGQSRVTESVELYERVLKNSQNLVISRNLVTALMHLGKYQEAREEIQRSGQEGLLLDLGTAISALTDGPDKAIILSQGQFGNDDTRKAQLLWQASLMLLQLRKYDAAGALVRAAQRFAHNAEFDKAAKFALNVKPYEQILAAEEDPRSPVQRFLVLAALGSSSSTELSALLSKNAEPQLWVQRLEEAEANLGATAAALRVAGIERDVLVDLLLSHSTLEVSPDKRDDNPPVKNGNVGVVGSNVVTKRVAVSGENADKPAFLVTVHSDAAPLGLLTFFVVKEEGKAKIIGCGQGLESIGKLILVALNSGDLHKAQAWLDLVKDNALPISPKDDKGPAIRYLWAGVAEETRKADFAKAAGASLLGTYSGSAEAIRILSQLAEHPPRYMDSVDLYFAICEALQRSAKWKELAPMAERLVKSRSYSESALRFEGEALIHMHDWHGLSALANAHLSDAGKNHLALQFAAISALMRQDDDMADKYMSRAKNAPYNGFIDDDLLARWSRILAAKTSDIDLDENKYSPSARTSVSAYSLALLELKADKLDEGHRSLLDGLVFEPSHPSGLAWIVEGQLLQKLGIDASDAYQKARTSGELDRLPFATALLPN